MWQRPQQYCRCCSCRHSSWGLPSQTAGLTATASTAPGQQHYLAKLGYQSIIYDSGIIQGKVPNDSHIPAQQFLHVQVVFPLTMDLEVDMHDSAHCLQFDNFEQPLVQMSGAPQQQQLVRDCRCMASFCVWHIACVTSGAGNDLSSYIAQIESTATTTCKQVSADRSLRLVSVVYHVSVRSMCAANAGHTGTCL